MSAPVTQSTPLEAQIVEVVRGLLIEQGKERAARNVTSQSSFQNDLGLSSLDLVELVVRCETQLEIEIPGEVAEQADTAAGWAKAIQEGTESAAAKSVYRIIPPTGDPVRLPSTARDLVDVLYWHAENAHGRVHIHLLEDGSGHGITCDHLLDQATRVARGLIALGLCRNDTVAILLPTGADFFHAFYGVMLAGGIPVPIYPPANLNRIGEYVERQIHVLRNASTRFLISFDAARPIARLLRVNLPSLIDVTTVANLRSFGDRTSCRLPHRSEIALIQYTSGTTSDPKGVALTHQQILNNIRAIGGAVGVRPDDAVVSWLPLASDLGLVGCWLFSLYHAAPLTLLPPQEFLERPESWLWAIHDSRGTLSAAPNFAYEYCARRIPMWTLEGIDLSSWRVAVNAGEAVMESTVRQFTNRFSKVGFRAGAMTPAYGLAESTVALAFSEPGQGPKFQNGFCSVGRPLPGHEARIVDSSGRPVSPGQTGRLEFRGDSRCSGYYHRGAVLNPAETWMDTGDLAFELDGLFFFAGRLKDVILRQGRQIAPEPIESAVASLPGVKANAVAVVGVPDPSAGTEKIAVVAETTAENGREAARVEHAVIQAATAALGFPPDIVRIVPPDSLPKTANAKIRRKDLCELLAAGKTVAPGSSPRSQLAGLAWRHGPRLAARFLLRTSNTIDLGVRNTAARTVAALARCSRSGVQPGVRAALGLLGRLPTPEGTMMHGPVLIVSNRSNLLDALSVVSLVENQVALAGDEALLGLPDWASRLLRPLVVRSRQECRDAFRAGKTVILFPDAPLGTPVARCRYRLPAIEAAIDEARPILPFGMQIIRNRLFFRVADPIAPAGLDARPLRLRIRQAIANIYA